MFQDYRVVVVTPAGRQRYLELLIPQVKQYRGVVDEYRLWVNTTNGGDIEFMKREAAADPEFVKLEYLPPDVRHDGNISIRHFFKNCQDPKTIYVRFDDDIVCLDTVDALRSLLQFRKDHPEFFVVYGTIVNNAIVTHLLQRFGKLDLARGFSGYQCMDNIGWKCPLFAENVHRQVLQQASLEPFRSGQNWHLVANERVSINCISWMGSDFAEFRGEVERDEEQFLSCDKPKRDGRINVIFGGFACVHYAFFTQRPHMDGTDVLQKYRERLNR
jgi:hypothetical protein